MDVLGPVLTFLFVLAFVLGVIAVVGHGLWVFFAALFRAVAGKESALPVEYELDQMRTVDVVLERLLAAGELDEDTATRLRRAMARRRQAVRGERPPRLQDHVLSPRERLERLLGGTSDPAQLPLEQRQRALRLLRQLDEHQQEQLPAAMLLAAARLLRLAGLTSRALVLYRLLLERHPHYAERAADALEAGRLALTEQHGDQARWFLAIAQSAGSVAQEDAARALLARLESPRQPEPHVVPAVEVAEEVLEVLPVEPPVVAEAARMAPSTLAATLHSEQAVAPSRAAVPAEARPAPLPPRPPRRRLRDLLAAFMEERNILWGELAGGLLIVGCSIALVATLWQNLQDLPYFTFLIFSAVTAALFAAGEYTLHHWKLQSTSRGLLLISLLMTPLNLLVLTNPAHGGSGWLEPLVKGGALLLAAGLIRTAGRDLIGTHTLPGPLDRRWLLTLALLGGSAAVLFLPQVVGLEVLIWLPVACHGLTLAAVLAGLFHAHRQGAALQERQAGALFAFVGLSTFAVAVVLGFLLINVPDVRALLPHLAVPLDLLGVPLVFAGLLVHRLLPRSAAAPELVDGNEPPAPFTGAALHLWGTAIGLSGLLLLFAGLPLAWPHLLPLVVVCLLNGVLLTALAFRWQLPAAHAFAVPSLTAAALLLTPSPEANLAAHLLSARSGLVLILVAWAFTGLAGWLLRGGRGSHARAYFGAADGIAIAALGLSTFHGLDQPALACVVYALSGVLALLHGFREQRRHLGHVGLSLLVTASLWGLQAFAPARLGLWGFTLSWEAVLLALASWMLAGRPLRQGARDLAGAVGLLALALALFSPDLLSSPMHTATAALVALAAFLLAAGTRWAGLSWIGSGIVLAALVHLFRWDLASAHLLYPELTALLTHAALTLLGSLLLTRAGVYLWLPLRWSARVVSLLAVGLLLLPEPSGSFVLTAHAVGLALVWLVLAWVERNAGWLSAFQAGITLAVVLAVRASLGDRPTWTLPSLYTYGLALAALELAWIGVRFALNRQPRVADLFSLVRPPLDRVLLMALTLGHVLLALLLVAPGVATELSPAYLNLEHTPLLPTAGYELPAGLFLAVLALALLAALREQATPWPLLGLLVVVLSVPLLTAAPWDIVHATATALCWHLAAAFLLGCVFVWARSPLERLAGAGGVTWQNDRGVALVLSHALLLLALAAVLTLTLIPPAMALAGQRVTGADSSSVFGQMGKIVASLIPLLLLLVGLIGHSLRERSPAYAFGAGLLANLIVSGGYALSVVLSGTPFAEVHVIRLVQLAGLTFSLWSLVLGGWDLVHRYLDGQRARAFLAVQIALGLLGCLILPAVVVLQADCFVIQPLAWAAEVGSPLGWLTLLAAFAAVGLLHARLGTTLSWAWVFTAGLTATALLACTLELVGKRHLTILLAWPLHSLAWTAFGWLSSRPAIRTRWLSLAGLAENAYLLVAPCVISAVGALFVPNEPVFLPGSAASFALTAAALAVLALWQRRDLAAFLAGAAVNLAVSLLTLYLPHGRFVSEGLQLLQINILTWAVWVLSWLAARRWLPGWQQRSEILIVAAPLAFLAHLLLALVPFVWLLFIPRGPLPATLGEVGDTPGWLALLAAFAACCVYLVQVRSRALPALLTLAGLQAGILAACFATRWDTGTWLSFHVLLLAWCVTGLLCVAGGSVSFALGKARSLSPEATPTSFILHPSSFILSESFILSLLPWMEVVAVGLVGLVLRGVVSDPWRPYTAMLGLGVASAQMAAAALWLQREYHVRASGLLLASIALFCWLAWGPATLSCFLLATAVGLAGSATLWALIELSPLRRPALVLPAVPFSAFATGAALFLCVVAVSLPLAADLSSTEAVFEPRLAVAALLTVGLALLLSMWEPRERLTLLGLYVLGLAVLGLGLHEVAGGPVQLGWYTALALAGYAGLVGLLRWQLYRLPRLPELLRLPARTHPLMEDWLVPAQMTLGIVVLPLSVWICMDMPAFSGRIAGPGAVLLLVLACVLPFAPGQRPLLAGLAGLRTLALMLASLAVAELAWAGPDPLGPAVWLERNAFLLLTLSGLTALYGVALPRWRTGPGEWIDAAYRLVAPLAGLAVVVLALLLTQEGAADAVLKLLLTPEGAAARALQRMPLPPAGVAGVLIALVLLMASSLYFAIMPGRDPLGLSQRKRTLYVYALELLLVVLFLQLRLTMPELFRGRLIRYWTVAVMFLAFLGVGLSELFERRRLTVLAEPLQRTGMFLPLLPLLAFWLRRLALPEEVRAAPAFVLLEHFDFYALLWTMAALLYALLALTRRSMVLALVAALAGNFALWSLLTAHGIAFALHPQAWLIPLALIILAAEHINREQLSNETATGLRYLGISMIYVASTADLFITGLGSSLWLPVVLALLSVVGMLWGILCRIRAFLFLGFSFLVVDVFAMIWHAAVDRYHTWVWWACGIVLGVAILALFALFEKRRQDVLHLIEEMRRWR
jgi:hypothetical protein